MATGYTDAISGNGDDAFLVKYNKMGKVVWSKTYGDTGDDYSWDIIETDNGDLVGTGYTSSFGTSQNAATITRTDSAGNVKWIAALYTVSYGIDFYRAVETSTGHLLATGLMQSGSNKDEVVLAKFTKDGYFLWVRTIGSSASDEAMGLTETSQGHYLLAGLTQDPAGNGKTDFAVAKLDTAGGLIWSYLYGGSNSERLNGCVEFDNLYYFTGWSSSFGEGGNDVVLMETDTAGKVNWIKGYGTDRNELSFNLLYDGLDRTFVMAGYTEKFSSSTSNNNRNTFLLKTDISGNIRWAESYGGKARDGHWPTGLAKNADIGYYVMGSSNTFGTGRYDLFLTKVDSGGKAGCNTRTPGFKQSSAQWKASKFGTLRTPTVTAVKTTISGSSWKLSQKMQCCSLYIDAGIGDTLCPGDTAFIGSDPIGAYNYEWFKGGTSVSKKSNLAVPYSEGASYNLVVSSPGSGCATVARNVKVIDDKKPIMMPYDEVRFCAGDSLKLALVGDFEKADWISNTTTSLNDTGRHYFPKVSDSLFIEVETAFGCNYFDTVKLMSYDFPKIQLDDTTDFCDGDSVYIPVSSTHPWHWSTDTALKDTGRWTLKSAWYTVVSSNNQCVTKDSIWVEKSELPVIDLGPDSNTCANTEICFNKLKTAEIDFLEWNSTLIDDSFCTDLDTVVSVMAYGKNGCVATDTIRINRYLVVENVFSKDTVPGPSELTLDVGGDWLAQLWETGDTTQTILVYIEKWYSVTVVDQNRCSITDSVYAALGVGKSEITSGLNIYPNPFNDFVAVSTEDGKTFDLRLMDEMGRVVVNELDVHHRQLIDTSTLPKGIYLLETVGNGLHLQRTVLVKQ